MTRRVPARFGIAFEERKFIHPEHVESIHLVGAGATRGVDTEPSQNAVDVGCLPHQRQQETALRQEGITNNCTLHIFIEKFRGQSVQSLTFTSQTDETTGSTRLRECFEFI